MADQIQDLNPNVPVGSDPVSGGDEELRAIKIALQNSFPGMTGAWLAPGQDISMRDGFWRTITVTDQINSSAQVVVAAFTIDGSDGSLIGATGYGAVGGIRTGVGAYTVTLVDAILSPFTAIVCGSATAGFLVVNMSGFRATGNSSEINIFTNDVDSGGLIDATNVFVAVFDSERD